MSDDTTCQGSVGPLNDKTCEACGDRYGSEEEPKHPDLCPHCAATLAYATELMKEQEPADWFE